MAIEITTKTTIKKTSLLLVAGAVICAILAVVVGGGYLYLTFSSKRIDRKIEEKEMSSASLTKIIFEKEAEIIPIKNKISDFGMLISKHKSPFGIFEIIENNTLPTVWFSNLDFNSEEMSVSLSGNTDSFETLEQQMAVFEKEPLFQDMRLSSVTVSEESGVDFAIQFIFQSIVFNPNI